MEDIVRLAEKLANNLTLCEAYTAYEDAKSEILRNSEIYVKIKDYKEAHMRCRLNHYSGADLTTEEERRLSEMYGELVSDGKAVNFLESERRLLKLLEKIYETIGTACDVHMF